MSNTKSRLTSLLFLVLIVSSGMDVPAQTASIKSDKIITGELTDEQIENIVRRSYQYVALYNIINKGANDPTNPGRTGWNNCYVDTALKDHNLKIIARPNNDTLYIFCSFDLRKDAMILEVPAIDSSYASLMTYTYDHYINVPLTTRKGDFKASEKILFYTARTEGYKGEPVEGVTRIIEVSGDFYGAVFRVMPHANKPEKFKKIVDQMRSVNSLTHSEYSGGKAKPIGDTAFPLFGKTDADVFGNNLLEVMQFIFNHLTFDPEDEMDRGILAAYKPLGIEPGKTYDPSRVAQIDGEKFREISLQVQTEQFVFLTTGDFPKFASRILRPKGQTDLEAMVLVSVLGPLGLPLEEATYPNITTTDGSRINAQHDYVIRMSKDQLPPASAFWSLTLYDTQNGFFIPNIRKKYSVGENAGMKLNPDGGIDIHVAVEQPNGVPEENWLPINRKDENLDIILRLYVPDLKKLKAWKVPNAEIVR